jgi:hypothetical protein
LKVIENWIKKYIFSHPEFERELLDILTNDCPYREVCGEEYMEDYGDDYYQGRMDAYD